MKTMNKIFEKYGRWLGYRDAVRFEREMAKAIDKIIKTEKKRSSSRHLRLPLQNTHGWMLMIARPA